MEFEGFDRRVVLYAVAGLAIVEVPLVHLLVAQLSHVAAWVVTGISVLSFGWLVLTAARGRDDGQSESGADPAAVD